MHELTHAGATSIGEAASGCFFFTDCDRFHELCSDGLVLAAKNSIGNVIGINCNAMPAASSTILMEHARFGVTRRKLSL